MVEDVEKTPVRPKRRRRKDLYFISKKERFRLSVRKKMQKIEGKKNYVEYDRLNCKGTEL
jgi:hypothetical protein